MVRVNFVCLGNICRSPTAEGIFIQLVKDAGLSADIHVDSSGTSGWHEGERADSRSREMAASRGVDLPSRSRKFQRADFENFDYIVAMDDSNLASLRALAESESHLEKLSLLRSFDPESPSDASVPDPYYGGDEGFTRVFDICQAGCEGLLQHIRSEHRL